MSSFGRGRSVGCSVPQCWSGLHGVLSSFGFFVFSLLSPGKAASAGCGLVGTVKVSGGVSGLTFLLLLVCVSGGEFASLLLLWKIVS